MREIVKVLLQEGIDESMIHRVLDLIEEEYKVNNDSNIASGYLVTAPEYAGKYIPGKKYTVQQRDRMHSNALNGRAQEIADAANREGKTPNEIGDRRGYNKYSNAPNLKSPENSIDSAARRKYGNNATGKKKATKIVKTKFPDFKRNKKEA